MSTSNVICNLLLKKQNWVKYEKHSKHSLFSINRGNRVCSCAFILRLNTDSDRNPLDRICIRNGYSPIQEQSSHLEMNKTLTNVIWIENQILHGFPFSLLQLRKNYTSPFLCELDLTCIEKNMFCRVEECHWSLTRYVHKITILMSNLNHSIMNFFT